MKRKIYLMVFFSFILLFVIKIDAQKWVKMNPQFDPPGDYNLGNGIMLDKNNGWVVEELNKKAFQTTDGGLTWKLRFEIDNPSYGDIFFLDKTKGWITFAGGDSTVLFKTEDSGITWTRFVVPFMYRVFFINDTVGFGGGKLNFYKTTNGGESWNKVELGEKKYYFTICDLFFLDRNRGLDFPPIWNGDNFEPQYTFATLETKDGGNTWSQLSTNLDSIINLIPRNIAFIDSLNGVFTSSALFRVYYTNNGGTNWIKANIPKSIEMNDLYLFENGEGWIVGQSGSYNLLKTIDRGLTWKRADSVTSNRLYSISFLKDKSTGYIFGSHNTLLQYDKTVGIKEETKPHNLDLSLLQNYPNPFNPTTKISFSISQKS